MRRLTDSQRNILQKMADGWTLMTYWPEPEVLTHYLRLGDGLPKLDVSEYDLLMLKKAPRLIRHERTNGPARMLYYAMTPAGYRAIGREAH